MAVEKMSFVNVAGDIKEFDNFVMTTILPYEIQFVRALSVLDSVSELRLFDDESPYLALLKKMDPLIEGINLEIKNNEFLTDSWIDFKEIEFQINEIIHLYSEIMERKEKLLKSKIHKEQIKKQIIPIKDVDVEIDKLFHFDFMKFRFGKIPKDSFDKIIKYIEELDVIIFEVFREENEVFCMYFMPEMIQNEVDSLFASLYFERIRLSDEIKGYPKEALHTIDNELLVINSKLQAVGDEIIAFKKEYEGHICDLYNELLKLNEVFNVRKFAARSEDAFYITGWIPERDVKGFKHQVDNNPKVSVIVEDDEDIKHITPPTKLRNHWFFEPFELLVSMYGIPSYNEIDPTAFVAITYMLLFGIMFGDVGQGLVIALACYWLYKKKNMAAAKLGIYLGGCSMLSGLIYGSIFGNETFLEAYSPLPVINPMEFLSEILIFAIILGVVLIVIAMVLNIMNGLKSKDYGKILFDRNGIIGMVLYFSILVVVLNNVIDMKVTILPVVLMIIGSLIVIMLSHPLQNLLNKREHIFPDDKAGFFIEAIFEVIETILSILSNTISFIRVGAFALNHVGFFMAFHMLSEMVGGTGSIFVMIFGNILIIALEGLIVFIQGLRLTYYELFSRFFEGNGTLFKPFKLSNKLID